jgi:TolB protein
MKTRESILFIIMLMATPGIKAQHGAPAAGMFRTLTDIGAPAIPGQAIYREPGQEYFLSGSGENIWFGEDHFSFLWKDMQGDFIIQARMEFEGAGVQAHRKAGLMVRDGLSPDAAHISCVVHGDGLTSLQYRSAPGAEMEELQFEAKGPDMLQLEKKGDTYFMSVAHFGDTYTTRTVEVRLPGNLKAGLFICSHNDTVVEKARFTNVRIFGTAPDTLVQYRDYLGSMLEVMDVGTGSRTVLAGTDDCLEAPNWTRDGKSLIYNSGGLLHRFDLHARGSEVLPTGFADRNNNDHVISFDGKQLAISHHTEDSGGGSVIYTLPLEGGVPRRVTPASPSYLHGWSPDGKYLVYTGGRQDGYNIFRIPAEGGKEIQLTREPTLDDGPEYSPDGKYIYFNSARTGTMQIWRMEADGSNPVRLTDDRYNNWFPHVSPDNKWIVFLSYPPDVPAEDHPYYKRVYLRLMPVDVPEPKVIGYLYGGQGTINVPSWSPDSKRIAFVSNGN